MAGSDVQSVTASVPPGEKRCGTCALVLPRTRFRRDYRSADGLRARCKACNHAARVDYHAAKAPLIERVCCGCGRTRPASDFHKNLALADGLQSNCKDCHRAWARAKHRQKTYGLSVDQYETLLAAQGHACAICGVPASELRRGQKAAELSVDHDHVTGAVRGLLCLPCNAALATLDRPDWPQWFRAANAYLGRH